jgi:hypothetical protein
MKLTKVLALFGLVFAASAQVAMAQPSVVVENEVVAIGTPSVLVDVTFTPVAGNTVAGSFQITYNPTDLSVNVTNCAPVVAWSCTNNAVMGIISFASTPDFTGNLPGFTGTLDFDLTAASIGTYPLNVINENYADLGGGSLPPMGTMNGSIDIQDVPAPIFQLTHDGGGAGNTIDFGTDNTPGGINSTVNATVENIGNDDMNNLAGNCDITDDAGGVYTMAPDPAPFDLAPMATEGFMMNCSTDAPGTYNGVLTCTHNAASSPDVFNLVCTELPTPTYDSTPGDGNPLPPMNGNEGNGNEMSALLVANIGEMGSTLTGSCGLSGSPEITFDGTNMFMVAEGGSMNIGVQCSDANEGVFASTLTCTADPSASNAGMFTYAVDCTMGPPDPGMWGSTPAPGGDVDLTPGDPVVVGTDLTNAGQLLVRNAGMVGDENIDYTCDIVGGATEITQDPSPSAGSLVAGDPDTVINYSCDTSAAGNFVANVECVWTAPLEGVGGTENYTASCDVRDPFIDVTETPPSGTPQMAELMPGENTTFSFTFNEIVGEGGDGSVDTCTLATGTDFAITAPGAFPLTVPSGGSAQVDVTFTDPGVGDTFTDTLNCTVTDNPDGGEPEQTMVSWPLEVTVVGRNAVFRVTKDFDDDNPAGVTVTLECNTGLPLQQSAVIHDPDAGLNLNPGDFTFVDFVIVDFEPGAMDCDVTEVVPFGYTESYFADVGANGVAGSVFADDDGCHYEAVESADFICEITNELDIVPVTVYKEWIDDHPEYNLPTFAEITLWCNAPIYYLVAEAEQASGQMEGGYYSASQYIQPGFPGNFGVYPDWDGSTHCFVTETPEAGVEQDLSDCEFIPLAPGQGGECTVVNTRLFAGIPTLSQYGLILMALLMLGVGLIGFKRYS